MPVPTHFRFTVRGVFLSTPEQWSYGFHMSRKNAGEADAGLDDIDEAAVTSAISNFHTSADFCPHVAVQDWRAYVIGTNGRMEGNGPLLHTFTTMPAGAGDQVRVPPQVAVVISLLGATRGPGQFGRFYLPGVNKPVEQDSRLSINSATALATDTVQMLKNVSDAIDLEVLTQAACVNVSTRGGNGAGTIQEVDHVEVGRAFDTLRTRRNAMLEERVVGGHIDW